MPRLVPLGGLKLIQPPSAEQLRDLQTIMSLLPEEIMKSQMARAADPNATRPSGETALMVASRFGFAEIVEALLDAGAQIDKQDARGVPALFIAAENAHAGIVRLLLAHGADPLFKTTDATKFLFAAVVGGNTEIINLALQYPCQISAGSNYSCRRSAARSLRPLGGKLWPDEPYRTLITLVRRTRCKLRCKFRARTSPEEQGCDQTERIENKHDEEYQSNS